MKKRRFLAIILFSVSVFAGAVLLIMVILLNNYYSVGSNNSLISSQDMVTSLNGKEYKLQILKVRESDNSTDFKLENRYGFLKKETLDLSGFEDMVVPCENKTVNLGDDIGDVICLTGEVGAHSQNVLLIKLNDNTPQSIKFINDGQASENITSDVPNIIIMDYNKGVKAIAVDNRDYSTDPLSMVIRDYYVPSEKGFVFDKSINMKY